MSQIRWLTGVVVTLGLLGTASPLFAQGQKNFIKVKFESADGVVLMGSWYASARSAPVVMILHDLGQDSSRKEWHTLATNLQRAGYAVLAFDFRGHGNSTAVNPLTFNPANAAYKVRASNTGAIDVNKFPRNYAPMLVNDIAAAKAFLDIKNDGAECNSSSLILVGAGKGATLGALWLKSEWYRYRIVRFGLRQQREPTSQGKYIVAGVWLSMSHKLGTISDAKILPRLLAPGAANNMPMTFMYNSKNKTESAIAAYCEKKLKNEKNDKHKYIGKLGISTAAKLTGRELLLDPKTVKGLVSWLNGLKNQAYFNNWAQQDFQKTAFVWWANNRILSWATRGIGEQTMQLMNYSRFIR